MPKPRRVPYVVLEATIRRNAKLAALPSDAARLGYVYVLLGEAKMLRPQGRFASRMHFDEVAGRFARYRRDYLKTGLLECAPALCDDCTKDWGEMPDGTLVVHNFRRIQSDPWSAERAEDWRNERSDTDEPDGSNADQTVNERNTNDQNTVNESISPARATRARAPRQRDREESHDSEMTPQPPASGGRRTTRRERSGPMRSSTTYQVITDDTPIDEIPEQFRDLFAVPEPAEVPS